MNSPPAHWVDQFGQPNRGDPARPFISMAMLTILMQLPVGCGGGSGGNEAPPPPAGPPPPTGLTITRFSGTASNGTAFSARILNVGAYNLEWDATRGVIYASVPAASPFMPRSISAIDPVAESIVTTRTIAGGDPTRMRMTEDGSRIYVSVPATGRVLRLALPSLADDVTLEMGISPLDGSSPLYALDLMPQPGQPGTVAISRADPAQHPRTRDVVIFDDATPRPEVATHFHAFGITWSPDASRIYGITAESSGIILLRFTATPDGVAIQDGAAYGFTERAGLIDFVDGQLQSNVGEVIEESTLDRVGLYPTPFPCQFAVPRAQATLVFALCGSDADPGGTLEVYSFKRDTFQPLAKATIPGLQLGDGGFLTSFVHWGTDGLAFMTPGNQVVLMNGAFVTSDAATPQVAPPVQLLTDSGVSRAGAPFRVREIRLHASDVVADPLRDRLYLSLPGHAEYAANTVGVLDPSAGTFLQTVAVGSEPNRLALSGNSEFLYVGVDGEAAVRRLRLNDMERDATLKLGREMNMGPYYALQLSTAPGLPGTVGVARSLPFDFWTTPSDGIVVFDDAIQRPNPGGHRNISGAGYPNGDYTTHFAWGADSSTIYGTDTDTSRCTWSVFGVDGDGLNLQEETAHSQCVAAPLVTSNGVIHSSDGRTYQPSPLVLISTLNFDISPGIDELLMVPDEDNDRFIFVGRSDGLIHPTFHVVIVPRGATTPDDVISFRPMAEETVRTTPTPLGVALWGQDGVAVTLATGRVLLFDSPALASH